MKKKLLTTLAIVSVVLIVGCNCNEKGGLWSNGRDYENPDGGSGSGKGGSGSGTAVDLGTAGNFVILSKTGITDVPLSDITGNIGTSPITGAAITGLTCPEVTGTIYTVDDAGPACRVVAPAMLTIAVLDMEAAYDDVAGRVPGVGATNLNVGAGTLNGQTFAPGTYTWNTPGNVEITGNITLSGGANAVWIFQVTGTLTVKPDVKIILSGGAQAKNIFWQVAGVVALQERSHFEGTILAKTNITLTLGASVNGRLLAQTAVTLDQNTVTLSGTSGGGNGNGNGNGCKDKKDNHGDNGNGNGCKDKKDHGNHYGWNDNGKKDNCKKDNGKKDNGKKR
jgi:Ice-binding-like